MTTVDRAAKLGRLWDYLAGCGFAVEEVTDLAQIEGLVAQLGKPYITPMSSPAKNDFTEAGIICLVARKDGRPVMMGCARLEDIGSESIDRYWGRVFGRAYGAGPEDRIIGNVRSEVVSSMSRRLVYFGDLFVADGMRGSRLALRAFVALGHLAVALKWDPEWTYCFVRERDVMRGAAALYGFNRIFGTPFDWLAEPPKPRDRSELLVAVSRADLRAVTDLTLRAVMAGSGSGSDDQK